MEALKQIEGLIHAKWSIFKSILALVKLEAQLAGKSILPLLVSVGMFIMVLLTFWLLACILAGYLIFLQFGNFLIALGAVFLLNLVLIGFLSGYLFHTLKNMSFSRTRAYFSGQMDARDDYQKKIKVANQAN